MKYLGQIEGEDIIENDDSSVSYRAKAAIDSDGTGPHYGDPTAQDQTTYKPDLNADEDKYIVVPPLIRDGVAGVVMGCKAHVRNKLNGKETDAVVGDIGPRKKLGEISIATAKALGINWSPTSGGEDRHVIEYTLWPGIPAEVDGKTYDLQPK